MVTCIRGNLRAVCRKGKSVGYILVNMHAPLVEGIFTDGSGHAVKPCVIEDYNAHMGFMDKSDRMVDSYGIACRTWK
jgi:hypothetical protein